MLNTENKFYRFVVSQKWAVLGLVISFAAVVYIAVVYLAEAIYFDDPRHQNVALRSWMTPQYIAHSYDLPRPVVMSILEIEPETHFPKRMDRLADRLGLSLEELTTKVRTEAEAYRVLNND